MTKKKVKRRTHSIRKKSIKELPKTEIEKALIDNFVNLQKVLTNLSVKFENLSDQISKLLQLFEISAKAFVEKQGRGDGNNNGFLEKLDTLLEQNKTIARGLTLMEERLRAAHGSVEERPRYPRF